MIMGQSIVEIFKGSFVMLLLLAASIAALALIIERFWYFTRNKFNQAKGLAEIRRQLKENGPTQALAWAKAQKNPLGRLFSTALENLTMSGDELADLLYSQILDERIRYERLLGGMGTLANVATLLGLLGTVTGLIEAFHNIAVTGSGGPAVVSAGIAEALITTAFGLLIGIPTLFFYNYYSKKAADTAMTLESTSDRLLVMLNRYKRMTQAAGQPTTTQAPPPQPKPKPAPAPETGWEF